MNRASSFQGRMVISLRTGRVVGKVRKLVCDLDAGRLGGLLVAPLAKDVPAFGVPFEDIESIGEDAIMVRRGPEELGHQDNERVLSMLRRENRVYTTGLYTHRGKRIGYLVEPYFSLEQDMALVAFELFSDVVFPDRVRGILLHGDHIQLGQDLILVPEDLQAYLVEEDPFLEEQGPLRQRYTNPEGAGAMETPAPPAPKLAPASEEPPAPAHEVLQAGEEERPETAPPEPVPTEGRAELVERLAEAFPDDEGLPAPLGGGPPREEGPAVGGDEGAEAAEAPDVLAPLPESAPSPEPEPEEEPTGDARLIRFVLGKESARELRTADGRVIIRRGEVITEETVQVAQDHEMMTMLFLAASQTGGRSG